MVKYSKSIILGGLIVLSFTLANCTKDKAIVKPFIADPLDTISFKVQILPLMNTNCATSGCHDAASATNGYVFSDYGTISANAENGLKAMKGNGFTQMPFNMEKLDDSLINQFDAWIQQGKLNN